MANTVYDTETIQLQDETVVTLKPLPIGRLKKFMKAWKEFENMEQDEDAFDIYINCCGIALSRDLENAELSPEGQPTDAYREYLEDVLDMDTIFKILEVAGGLKLNDPKILEEAQKAADAAAGRN